MSIQQINEMTLEDCKETLIERLALPEGQEPTQLELEAEFEAYKAELIAEEQARLDELARLEDLKTRFSVMTDSGLIQAQGISNPAAYFRDDILKNPKKNEAETKLAMMEQKYQVAKDGLVDTKVVEIRRKIENILDKTDWLFISDVIVDSAHRTVYRDYRAKLRSDHNLETDYANFTLETFDNYARRTKPEYFMEGGTGPAMVKKFMSKLG